MAGYVEWDDVEPQKKGSGGGGGGDNQGRFARLGPNEELTIRPVFKAVEFYKYYNKKDGKLRTAIVENPDTCMVRPRYSATLKRAQARRGFLAFHREAQNRLRIFELPSSALEAFKHYKKVAKTEPGGPDGGDFKLKVVCPNGVKDRDTTYEIEFIEATPFTDEEKAFLKEHVRKDGQFLEDWDLQKIFASDTPELIEDKLFGDWEPPKKNNDGNRGGGNQGNQGSQRQSNPPQKQAAPAGKASNDDDPFQF